MVRMGKAGSIFIAAIGVALNLIASACSAAGAAEPVAVDLELVLAVDISRSMDVDERHLQRRGYVEALRHPAVARAVRSGLHGKIALTYFEWSAQWTIETIVHWSLIETQADLHRAAKILEDSAITQGSGTSISGALRAATAQFSSNNFDGRRRVIDVSGDGPNNLGGSVLIARAKTLAQGIVINGLPLVVKRPNIGFGLDNLDEYYTDCVVGGPGSFVLPVHSFERIGLAIRQKLVIEIANLSPIHDRPPVLKAATGTDCLIGEKMRNDYMRIQGLD